MRTKKVVSVIMASLIICMNSAGSQSQRWIDWGRGKLSNFYQKVPYPSAYLPGVLAGLYGAGKIYNLDYSRYPLLRQEVINEFKDKAAGMLSQYNVTPEWYIDQITRHVPGDKRIDTPIRGWLLENKALAGVTSSIEDSWAKKMVPYIDQEKSVMKYLLLAFLLLYMSHQYNKSYSENLEKKSGEALGR